MRESTHSLVKSRTRFVQQMFDSDNAIPLVRAPASLFLFTLQLQLHIQLQLHLQLHIQLQLQKQLKLQIELQQQIQVQLHIQLASGWLGSWPAGSWLAGPGWLDSWLAGLLAQPGGYGALS